MNHAERRFEEVEERLLGLEAPEPPPDLLAALAREIPEDLGTAEGVARRNAHNWSRLRWLAASLAVVTVGGVLGYRLLEERPLDRQPMEAAIDIVPPAKIGEPVDDDAGAPGVVHEAPRGDENVVVTDLPAPRVEAPVEELVSVDAVRGVARELGEAAGNELDRFHAELTDRLSELPAEHERIEPVAPGLLAEVAAPMDGVVSQSQELGRPRDRKETLRRHLQSLPRPSTESFDSTLRHGLPAPSTGGTAEPNDQPYGDMYFQGYGTNPFVDTEDDALSTFAIDVDTASYTMARNYLRRGNLPPADAVRVEEFVNYFDYLDPAPRKRDFAVVAEGAPSPFATTARTYLLRFALKGREIAAGSRKPAVLTFVVDVSGSMNRENRLGLVKRALRLLVGELDEGDAVGLVVYGNRGRLLLAPTSDHRRVLATIDELRPGGSTNAEEGLVLGYETARDGFREGAINRVILCSDGVANVGATGPESILRRIADEAERGIELTAVGFGMGNYNDVLMEQLADRGDGNYAYVDDVGAAQRVFVENLTGTLQTIAGDAKVQVEFDPSAVQSYRLLGYENRDVADRDFRNDAVDAGEIGAGHQVTALYEVKLRDEAADRGALATLRLRYRSKATGRVVEDSVELRRDELATEWSAASRGLRFAAVVARFAERLRGSYWARATSLRELAAEARDLGRQGRWDSEMAELTELIETAARLEGEGPHSEPGEGFER